MPELSHPVSSLGCFLALPRLEGPWQPQPGTGMLLLPSQPVSQSSPGIPEKPGKNWCSPFAGRSLEEVPHPLQSPSLPSSHGIPALPGYRRGESQPHASQAWVTCAPGCPSPSWRSQACLGPREQGQKRVWESRPRAEGVGWKSFCKPSPSEPSSASADFPSPSSPYSPFLNY